MKNYLFLGKFLAFILITGLALVQFSCKDDEVDCGAAENKIEDLYDDYYDAYFAEDCDEMEELRGKIISEAKKAKSCGFVKDAIEDFGADDFDELLEMLQEEFDEDAADAGC